MKIAHLSDLHFGTEDINIVRALQDKLHELNPDMIIISGDFTQIGNTAEFKIAGEFIRNLSCETICVPGNHDVPAYEMIERFFTPYKKYKKYICDDLCPVYDYKDVLILGLNSARRAVPHWNWANGAISLKQRQKICDVFDPEESRWTICTFHHPIHKVDDLPIDVTVFGGKPTLDTIKDRRIDLVLTGHVHHASLITRGDADHQTVYLSASTALSSRLRGQENGFNLITLDNDTMKFDVLKKDEKNFVITQSHEINKGA